MIPLRWKVCGLRDNIAEVAALRPDYIGFIFYPISPRYVGDDFEMPAVHQKSIKKVGVFVNEPVDKVLEKVNRYQLDFAQIHGHESSEYCEELRSKGLKVIKAFQVDENFDFGCLYKYESAVEYFLFDSKTKKYGGSGRAFDWNILQQYTLEKKYFLSGGISLENIDELKEADMTKIHALDVNSKFELRPGLKDIEGLTNLKSQIPNIK